MVCLSMFTIKSQLHVCKRAIHGSYGNGVFSTIPKQKNPLSTEKSQIFPSGIKSRSKSKTMKMGIKLLDMQLGFLKEKKQFWSVKRRWNVSKSHRSVLGGGFKHVFFIPIWGNDPNLTNIFQLS